MKKIFEPLLELSPNYFLSPNSFFDFFWTFSLLFGRHHFEKRDLYREPLGSKKVIPSMKIPFRLELFLDAYYIMSQLNK
jgi:hypothetical protein